MGNKLIKHEYTSLIFSIRGYSVMLDMDLAALYGVTTKSLKQQVKRNINRFPDDFMFVLTKEELKILRSQIVTSSWGGIRYAPMAFTELGVAMLSSVLHSEKAIQINIEIMRAFSKYRGLLKENSELHNQIFTLDSKVNKIFKYLMKRIDALHTAKTKKMPIGFKILPRNK